MSKKKEQEEENKKKSTAKKTTKKKTTKKKASSKKKETAKKEAPKKEKAPNQNGVTMPQKGVTARVWEIADYYSKETGAPAERADVLAACENEGINPSTATTQYGRWRRFHGIKKETTKKKATKEK